MTETDTDPALPEPRGVTLHCCGRVDEHAPGCWSLDPARLPWHRPLFTRRCGAVAEKGTLRGWHGRCDLSQHPVYVDHALERGFDTPRWSTRWTR